MQSSELLTARQAAQRLGVSVYTIAGWARSGKLPTAIQGEGRTGTRFFAVADVERLLAERTEVAS